MMLWYSNVMGIVMLCYSNVLGIVMLWYSDVISIVMLCYSDLCVCVQNCPTSRTCLRCVSSLSWGWRWSARRSPSTPCSRSCRSGRRMWKPSSSMVTPLCVWSCGALLLGPITSCAFWPCCICCWFHDFLDRQTDTNLLCLSLSSFLSASCS